MTDKQPEALRLAEFIENDIPPFSEWVLVAVASKLRTQHAEIERLTRIEVAWDEWQAKTEWVQASAQPKELGMHRADVLRSRIERKDALEAAMREPVAEVVHRQIGPGHGTPATTTYDVNWLTVDPFRWSGLLFAAPVAQQYEAGDMASAAAQGFRDGAASVAQQPQKLEDIEQYRMQMAGICTAATGYWKEGDPIHPDYDTPALRDVAKLYAKYDALYKAQQPQAEDTIKRQAQRIAELTADRDGWIEAHARLHREYHDFRKEAQQPQAEAVPSDVVRDAPPGYALVPVEVLKAASESLGSFVSDHGWTDLDMQAMDNLDAILAQQKGANHG